MSSYSGEYILSGAVTMMVFTNKVPDDAKNLFCQRTLLCKRDQCCCIFSAAIS